MSKRILIVTECFYPEEFKINDVALSWKGKGFDVDVLTLSPSYPLGKIYPGYKNTLYSKREWQGINVYRLHTVLGYKESALKKIFKYVNFMILGSIAALFIGRKYDYVLGFNIGALTGMLPAVLIGKIYRKPVTFWTLDIWPDSVYAYGFKKTKTLSYLLGKFAKFMYHSVDNIALSSKGFESRLKRYTKSGATFNYIPQWADDLDMSEKPANLGVEDKVQFTFAGNIGKLQNLENIIKAFDSLPNEYQKKFQFNIVGSGSNLDSLQLLAKGNSNIVFHGQQPRSSMARYYKASDFLIISLIGESVFSTLVPAKLQTYIAAKKPIIAIINGDTADFIRDNNLGLFANPRDIDAIAEVFFRCVNMGQDEQASFTKKNDYLLNTIFNKEKIIDALLDLTINNFNLR